MDGFDSTITVNSTGDAFSSGDGACILREAIVNANTNADSTAGDCAAGVGADLKNLLEFLSHGGVPGTMGGLHAPSVGVPRLLVPSQVVQRCTETSPGVPLILGSREVGPEFPDRVLGSPGVQVFQGQPETEAWIFGMTLEHPLQRRDTISQVLERQSGKWKERRLSSLTGWPVTSSMSATISCAISVRRWDTVRAWAKSK